MCSAHPSTGFPSTRTLPWLPCFHSVAPSSGPSHTEQREYHARPLRKAWPTPGGSEMTVHFGLVSCSGVWACLLRGGARAAMGATAKPAYPATWYSLAGSKNRNWEQINTKEPLQHFDRVILWQWNLIINMRASFFHFGVIHFFFLCFSTYKLRNTALQWGRSRSAKVQDRGRCLCQGPWFLMISMPLDSKKHSWIFIMSVPFFFFNRSWLRQFYGPWNLS